MSYYLWLIFLVFIIAVSSTDKRAGRTSFFYLASLLFVVLLSFAGTRLIGLDYETYFLHYKSVPDIFRYTRTDTSMEIGYELLVSLCKSVSESFHFFLFVFTGLSLWVIFIVCYKYSPYPLLSFYMFFSYSFFTQIMGQMRQPIAVFIAFLVLVPLLMKQRRVLACIWIIVAGIVFHKSIFFLLFFLLFADKVLSKKKICILSVIALVCYMLSSTLSQILLLLIPPSFFLYDAAIAYLSYKASSLTFSMGMVERVSMVGILFYYSYKYRLYAKEWILRLFVNLYFVGACLYFAFIAISAEFASRGTQVFSCALFFALPILVEKVNLRDKYILLCIICAWAIYISMSFMKDSDIYLPYKTILS